MRSSTPPSISHARLPSTRDGLPEPVPAVSPLQLPRPVQGGFVASSAPSSRTHWTWCGAAREPAGAPLSLRGPFINLFGAHFLSLFPTISDT